MRGGRHRTRRRCRSGFTLTEILMAVGILAVGLSMVASVFPVAVDQNRRSFDLTQASLCARSTAAMMRARRYDILKALLGSVGERLNVMSADDPLYIPHEFRTYDPRSFLYGQGAILGDESTPAKTPPRGRSYHNLINSDQTTWSAGRYSSMIFMTRIYEQATGMPSRGPYRVTLVVYRARGKVPIKASGSSGEIVGPGDYLVDVTGSSSTNQGRGEAYLLDAVTVDANKSITAATVATKNTALTSPNYNGWYRAQGAVVAFHTVIGD